MNIRNIIRHLRLIIAILPLGGTALITSCSDDLSSGSALDDDASYINIGGVSTDQLVATSSVSSRVDENHVLRTTSSDPEGAENKAWLVQPLKNGFDITYGLYKDDNKSNERVAILKLLGGTLSDNTFLVSEEGLADYSFTYRDDADGSDTQQQAKWYDNGLHYFEGVHVPNRIRYIENPSELETIGRTINEVAVSPVVNITSDQHDDAAPGTDNQLGNYTLLEHYLSMPASTHISATVSRIKLPFQHRLARVLVYVLIDPTLGTNTKIRGYKSTAEEQQTGKEDASSSDIRFCNVEVLEGVKDVYDTSKKIHTLTPKWKTQRKIIPHFVGESGTCNSNGMEINADFLMYTSVEKEEHIFSTSDKWQGAHNAYTSAYANAQSTYPSETPSQLAERAAAACGYRETNYGKVPLYDIIVRPTYTRPENVMYDENLTAEDAEALVNYKNAIDFEITLNTNLQYQKHFEFDLDANYQTVVYLRISREKVDYNTSGAEKWIVSTFSDAWYGLDNENGNTLSLAGNSWQRAYYNYKVNYGQNDVTDGHYYQQDDEGLGQYVTPDNWKKLLAEAYQGGAHHGDYFILHDDITIDASELPADFVFTGHLDGRDHTITFTGAGEKVYDVVTGNYPSTNLYVRKTGQSVYSAYVHPASLYICNEVAQGKPRKADGVTIPAGSDMMTEVHPSLNDIMGNTVDYYIKNADGSYSLYNPRPWIFATLRSGAASLFCGLNGNYTTNQESASPRRDESGKIIWEANVHKETNKTTVWVPTSGYRGEVLNVKVKDGTLFPDGYSFPNSGNVRNCYDITADGTEVRSYSNTPDLPEYK